MLKERENKMGQELLDTTGYQRKPRTYYHAVALNGAQALRGSGEDKYTHAVVMVNVNYPKELSYATFHSSKQLATRQLITNENWQKKSIAQGSSWWEGREWEVVELKKISAREYRAIKKADSKACDEYTKKSVEFSTGLFVTEGEEVNA
jgi:hypothetical protein